MNKNINSIYKFLSGEEDKSPLRIGTRDSDDGTQLPSSANISRSSTNEHENLNTTTTSEELLPTPYFGRPLSEIGGVNKMPVLVEDAINYLSDPSKKERKRKSEIN